MGWPRIFRGASLRLNIQNCTKRRWQLVESPHPRKVQGSLLPARCSKPVPERDRQRRLRGKPLRDRGKQEETKSPLHHLIKFMEEKRASAQGGVPPRTNNMADNSIPAVNDGNFEAEVLTASNSKPVMVDFWAEWCRPCHMLAPTVAEIAQDYEGRLKVMKLNVDEAMNSAGRYNVRGIPTLLVFKNGQVVEQIVGAVPKEQITKALDRHLG